jgi:hypothetical protein
MYRPHIDTYLTWAETPAMVAEKIADVRARAQALGRRIKVGLRVQIIVRETTEEAWAAAHRLIRYVSQEDIQEAQSLFDRFDSVGQRRMTQLVRDNLERLEVSPNLWAGIGQVRGGVGTALVGNPDEVAERLKEYASLGIDTFILSGYPHLEEAYRIAELLFPRLPVAYPKTTGSFALGADGRADRREPKAQRSIDRTDWYSPPSPKPASKALGEFYSIVPSGNCAPWIGPPDRPCRPSSATGPF